MAFVAVALVVVLAVLLTAAFLLAALLLPLPEGAALAVVFALAGRLLTAFFVVVTFFAAAWAAAFLGAAFLATAFFLTAAFFTAAFLPAAEVRAAPALDLAMAFFLAFFPVAILINSLNIVTTRYSEPSSLSVP
ncbi:hypothetical protein Q668_12395 [Alcanivorax sp. PN-3]|nr:hypothetical protein Q668_12395 [Alcanivorax sp. PN-3]